MTIEEELRQLLVERLFLPIKPEAIAIEKPLSDYGVDSFLLLEMVVAMEERFGVRFVPADITSANLRSIAALAALILSKRQG